MEKVNIKKEDIINTFRRENKKGDELDKKIELSALEYGHMAFTFMIFILGFINIGIKNPMMSFLSFSHLTSVEDTLFIGSQVRNGI